jgi:hypothetical protein
MLFWNSLSRWIRPRAVRRSGRPHGPGPGRPRSWRPRLQVLEDRTLLSTYLVDRLTDSGAGSGLTGDLRYAITHAMDADTINFGVTGTIEGNYGITHSISIEGPGPDQLSVWPRYPGSIFEVTSGTTVSIAGLTIAGSYYSGDGGGISNVGTLTVNNCTIRDNSVMTYDDGGGPYGGDGGGIYSSGTLTVTNSTISGNSAEAQGGGICCCC